MFLRANEFGRSSTTLMEYLPLYPSFSVVATKLSQVFVVGLKSMAETPYLGKISSLLMWYVDNQVFG